MVCKHEANNNKKFEGSWLAKIGGGLLKKKFMVFMVFGILLIFVGIIIISLSNTYEIVHKASEVASRQNADEISAYFSTGENISIVLTPGSDWSPTGGLIEDGGFFIILNVTLFSPNNGKTIFRLYFNVSQEPPFSPDQPWPIFVSKVELLCVDKDSLEVSYPLTPQWIGGIIKQNGTFTVKSDRHPVSKSPPSLLAFYRAVTERRYPYSNFFSTGCLLSIIGSVVSLWNLIFGKKRKRRKLRK